MSSRITYRLIEPVTFADEEVTELTLRDPRMKDLREAFDPNQMAFTAKLVARLAAQPLALVDSLGAADALALGELVGRFFPQGSPTTGES